MKYKIIVLSLCTFLTGYVYSQELESNMDHATRGRTFFSPRPFGQNIGRQSAGVTQYYQPQEACDINGFFTITGAYGTSFDSNALGTFLFFNGTSTMSTGTAAGPGIDIFSQEFLLNDNFKSSITASPKVRYTLAEATWYLALDEITQGLYLLGNLPFGWTSWQVDLHETVSTRGTTLLAQQIGNSVAIDSPLSSMIEAWKGTKTLFDIKEPLTYARIDGAKKEFKCADLTFGVGYTFLHEPSRYLSFNLRTVIPTGNRPNGQFVFEPMMGNGHHIEIGGGVLGNLTLRDCPNQKLNVFLNGALYHVCKARQKRTFDLTKNGIGSRYLLFKQFDQNGQYTGTMVRGPNILTLNVDVSNTVEGDVAVIFDYQHCNLVVNVGYNVWGRTTDTIKLKQTIPANTYGIAGLTGTDPGANRNRTASLTQIDGENADVIDPANVYLTTSDLNLESAEHPGCFSHSILGYLGYQWKHRKPIPFIGIGSQIEFSGTTNTALRLVHLFAKAGCSF